MVDEHAAAELEIFIENDAALYRQQHVSILKNLATKKARGEYKHDLAVKLFGYLVEAGAKKYTKEFGGVWHQVFEVPTRRAVAESFAKSFETEHGLGNYDALLPKKYQKEEAAPRSQHKFAQITAAGVRTYADTGQTRAWVNWSDGSSTSGNPESAHMKELLARAKRSGVRLKLGETL